MFRQTEPESIDYLLAQICRLHHARAPMGDEGQRRPPNVYGRGPRVRGQAADPVHAPSPHRTARRGP